MRRHDKAQEKLAKAQEEWYESQTERKSSLEQLRHEVENADKDMEDTNNALHTFRTLKEKIEEQKKKDQPSTTSTNHLAR